MLQTASERLFVRDELMTERVNKVMTVGWRLYFTLFHLSSKDIRRLMAAALSQ